MVVEFLAICDSSLIKVTKKSGKNAATCQQDLAADSPSLLCQFDHRFLKTNQVITRCSNTPLQKFQEKILMFKLIKIWVTSTFAAKIKKGYNSQNVVS